MSTNPQMTGICRTILTHVCTPIIRACIESRVPAYILDACALNPFDILKPCMTGTYLHIVRRMYDAVVSSYAPVCVYEYHIGHSDASRTLASNDGVIICENGHRAVLASEV